MHYNFYFDETYHDRKIAIKSSGQINTFTADKNDSYVGVFWGIENTKQSSTTKRLFALENKYLARYGLTSEFKSVNIARKNFNYGVRSFNKDALDYYSDLFKLLEQTTPIIHVNVVSKIEYLVRNIFEAVDISNTPFVSPNSFYYSITKFLIYYHTPELIKALYKSIETADGTFFQEELLNHLECTIAALKGIPRKAREIPALQQLHMVVSLCKFEKPISDKYDFIYFQNFDGLIRLLDERKISSQRSSITIDREEATFQAAQTFPFKEVKQANSTQSVKVRMADHLCGFIGRMMYSLMNDKQLREDEVTDIDNLSANDLTRKRLLSPEWFDLKQANFDLYKRAFRVLVVQQEAYWATMTWSYCDQVSMFYTLLRYFGSYGSYEEYKKHSPEEHSEYYNSACCDDLERHYAKL